MTGKPVPRTSRLHAAAINFLLCSFLARMAVAGLPIGLVLQSVRVHQPPVAAADAIALFCLTSAISAPLVGQVNDRGKALLARYRIGLCVFALATTFIGLQTDMRGVRVLLGASLAGGLSPLTGSSWSGAAKRLLGRTTSPRLRSYDVGTYAIAAIVAPVLVGVLAPLGGRQAPMAACAAMAVLAASVSAPLRAAPADSRSSRITRRRPGWRELVAHWPLVALLLVTMGIQPVAVAGTLNSPYLSTRIFGSPREAGLILTIISIGTLASSLTAHMRLLRRIDARSICLGVVLASVLLPVARPGWLGAVLLMLIGVGNGLLLVATFDRVDTAFRPRLHSRVFAVAETSRLLAASGASWALGRIDTSPTRSILLGALPIACLLVLPLSRPRQPHAAGYGRPALPQPTMTPEEP